MMLRRAVAAAIGAALLVPLAPAAADASSPTAQEADDELPDGARTIIGSPDPGPKPDSPGDRGGWAQLMTLGVLVAAVGFILWRVFRVVRTTPGPVRPPDPRRSR